MTPRGTIGYTASFSSEVSSNSSEPSNPGDGAERPHRGALARRLLVRMLGWGPRKWLVATLLALFLGLLGRDILIDRRDSALAAADARVQWRLELARRRSNSAWLVKARIVCPGDLGVAVLMEGRFSPDIGRGGPVRYRLSWAHCADDTSFGYSGSDVSGRLKARLAPELIVLDKIWMAADAPRMISLIARQLTGHWLEQHVSGPSPAADSVPLSGGTLPSSSR